MSKIAIWIIAGLVVIGGGYFFITAKKVENVDTNRAATMDSTKEESKAPSGKKIAFSEFVKQGGSYKCTVHQNVGNVETVGTTYVNSGMIRGEYNTKLQGMSIDSTFIVRDGYSYGWTSTMPNTGFKVKIVQNAAGEMGTGTSGKYSFNAEQIGDYDCQPWTVDASKFIIPTNITFKEIIS